MESLLYHFIALLYTLLAIEKEGDAGIAVGELCQNSRTVKAGLGNNVYFFTIRIALTVAFSMDAFRDHSVRSPWKSKYIIPFVTLLSTATS